MSRYDHLPIFREATRLTAFIEEAVRRFPRYHKYALGTDLRRQAYRVCRLVIVGNRAEGERRLHALDQLCLAVDELKVMVQLGREIQAFSNFGDFERAAEMAVVLGKQSGGWRRSASSGKASDASRTRPEGAPHQGRAERGEARQTGVRREP